MKPIKLEIAGLHSFEQNQVIDFNALCSRGVFGIFGATGSGKSTILDAIVLALYGKVHRSKTNSDFINLKSKQAVVVFNFTFAETGKTKEYSIKRIFKRKAKNKDEIEQTAEVFEIGAFGAKQIVEGVGKVDNFIKELIGMSDAEFLKCIALPQGEFASFLKSKPNERVSIIGNIFDLNKYGQELWEKVKVRTEKLEKELAVIDGKINVVGVVDDLELQSSKIQLNNLQKEIETKQNQLAQLILTHKEEGEVARLGEELDIINKKLKELEHLHTSFELKKESLNRAKKLRESRFVFDRVDELNGLILNEEDDIYRKTEILKAEKARTDEYICDTSQELSVLKEKLVQVVSKLERLLGLKTTENKLKQKKQLHKEKCCDFEIVENKVKSLENKITSLKVDKGLAIKKSEDLANEIATLQEELRDYESLISYNIINDYSEELKSYKSFLDSKYEEAVHAMASSTEKQSKLNEQKKNLNKDLKELYAKYGLKGVTSEGKMFGVLEQAHEEYSKFSKLKGVVEMLMASRLEVATAICAENNKRDKIEADKAKLDLKFKLLTDEISEINLKVAKLREERDVVLAHNGVGNILSKVKIGDSCPICKSEVLQKEICNTLDVVVVEKEIADLCDVISRKEEAKDNVLYSIAKLVSRLENIQSEIENLETKQNELKSRIKKLFSFDFESTILDEEDELKRLEKIYLDKIIEIKDAVKKEKYIFIKLNEINEELTKQTCVNVASRMEVDCHGELLNRVNESIKNKDVLLLGIVSQNENISDKISRMEKINQLLEKKLLAKEDVDNQITQFIQSISKLETELALAIKEHDDLSDFIKSLSNEISTMKIAIDAETVGGDVLKTISLQEAELEELNSREKQIVSIQEERRKSVNLLEFELNSVVAKNKEHKKEHNNLVGNISKILKDLNLSSVQEARLFNMEDSEILKLEQSINNFNENYNFLKTRKGELDKLLDGRVSSSIIISQIETQIEVLRKEISVNNDDEIKIKLEIERLEEKLNLLTKLKTERLKIDNAYTLTKDLYDLLKGKALLEFIAEEFINDISFMASAKLQILMDGRYVLKYKNKEFFVVDNFNDACDRPVSTLSGGELFVVSLALALSISDAISSKSNKNIDFFFLDEGFGTLDKDYCEYIVDSLIKLESQNLTIGLISHIPELQEKIIQKLEVVKTPVGTIVKSISDI